MSFIFRHVPECSDNVSDDFVPCDTPIPYRLCGGCGEDTQQYWCYRCEDDPDPDAPRACAPCYEIKEITVLAIAFTAGGGCGGFTLNGGTVVNTHSSPGLVCLPATDCREGLLGYTRWCTWRGDNDAMLHPLSCVDEEEYCEGNENTVLTGVPAFIGSYTTSGSLGCHGAGGCETVDTITSMGVWVEMSVVSTSKLIGGRAIYGRKTHLTVLLCPYLSNFGCYTNMGLGYGSGGDEWIFRGTSDFMIGCGCATDRSWACSFAGIECEAAASDTFEIPTTHHSRVCVGCSGSDVPAPYSVDGDEIGEILVKFGTPQRPCRFEGDA